MVMYMIPELPEHFFLMVAAFTFGPGVFLVALSAVLGLLVSLSRARGGDVLVAGLGITVVGYVVGILGLPTVGDLVGDSRSRLLMVRSGDMGREYLNRRSGIL